MVETKAECPRCGERAEEGWSYCPYCAMLIGGTTDAPSTLSSRIKYVQRGTESRQRRNAIIQSLANISIGVAILLMLGGGIILFHPAMVPRLFQPKVSFVLDDIPRVSAAEDTTPFYPSRVVNEWIRVEGGDFQYGPKGNTETEYLHTFEIQMYEVTNSQWAEYLEKEQKRLETEGHYEESVPRDWEWDPDSGNAPGPSGHIWDVPVRNITWYQAQDYCEKYLANQPGCEGARLPTPLEWVKAARGPQDDRKYPWGDEFFIQSNVNGVIQPTPRCNSAEAGKNAPQIVFIWERDVSPYGVIGMAGNVSEFVGVSSRGYLAYRGGCFQDDSYDARIDIEPTPVAPGSTHRWTFVGFRAARSVDVEEGE